MAASKNPVFKLLLILGISHNSFSREGNLLFGIVGIVWRLSVLSHSSRIFLHVNWFGLNYATSRSGMWCVLFVVLQTGYCVAHRFSLCQYLRCKVKLSPKINFFSSLRCDTDNAIVKNPSSKLDDLNHSDFDVLYRVF